MGRHRERVVEESRDDVDSGGEADVTSSQPEATKVSTFPSIGVSSVARLGKFFGGGWGGANTSVPNLDKGPGSQTAFKPSGAQEAPPLAPPTVPKGGAKAGKAQKEKPIAQEPLPKIEEAVGAIGVPEPEKEPESASAPVPEQETETAPAPAREPRREEREPMPSVKQNKKDKDKEKEEAREAAKLERGKRIAERSKREKELELEQQGEKGARGVRGSKVAAAAAVFETKAAAASPQKKKGKGTREKSGPGLVTEVEPKVEPEPAVEPMPEAIVEEVVAEPEPESVVIMEVAPEPDESQKEDSLHKPTTPEEEDTYGPGYGKLSQIQYADTSGIGYAPTPDQAPYAPAPKGPKYAQLKPYEYAAAPSLWSLGKPKKTTRGVAHAPTPAPLPAPGPPSAPIEAPAPITAPAPTESVVAKLAREEVGEAPLPESLKSPVEEYGGVEITDAAVEVVVAEPEMAPAPAPEEEPGPAPAPAPKGREREREREREKKSKKDVSVWDALLGAPKTAKKKAPDVEVSIDSNPFVIESESEVDHDAEIGNGEQRVRRSSIEVDANGSPIKVVGFRELWKMNKEVGKRQKSTRNTPLVENTQEEAIQEAILEATLAPPPAPELTIEIPPFEG